MHADDFPAAHSMDTTWFAVDADGYVARFDSGEAGAVPNDAAIGMSPGDSTIDTFVLESVCLAHYLRATPLTSEMRDDLQRDKPTWASRLMVLIDPLAQEFTGGYREGPAPSAVEEMLQPFEPSVISAAAPRLVITNQPVPLEVQERVRAHRETALWCYHDDLDEWLDEHGLPTYQNDDYDSAETYVRAAPSGTAAPSLRLDDLPPALAASIAKVKLPIRFRETPQIQLADHFTDEQVATYSGDPLRPPPGYFEKQAADREARNLETKKKARVALGVIVLAALAALYALVHH